MSYSPAGSDALDPQVAVMPGGQNTAVRVGSSESGDIAQAATRLHLINLRYTRSSHWSRGECAPPQIAAGPIAETAATWVRGDGSSQVLQAAILPPEAITSRRIVAGPERRGVQG
jgi:hypothetical protein